MGLTLAARLEPFDIEPVDGGMKFKAIIESDVHDVIIPLLGEHNVKNTLAVLSVVHHLDLDISSAIKALARFRVLKDDLSSIIKAAKLL